MPSPLLVSHLLFQVSWGSVMGRVGDISQACSRLAGSGHATVLLLNALNILHTHSHEHERCTGAGSDQNLDSALHLHAASLQVQDPQARALTQVAPVH